MNSRLDKFTTFKKRIYSLDLKWPENRVCRSSKCNSKKKKVNNLRHSFVKAYLTNLQNNRNISKRTWQEELNSWKRAPPHYLENIPFRFFWNTSGINSSLDTEFKSVIFDASTDLTENSQDYSKYNEHIDEHCKNGEDTISFPNIKGKNKSLDYSLSSRRKEFLLQSRISWTMLQ